MSEKKTFSLVKPTLDTPFHIDFAWWQQNDRDWRVYLRSMMCVEHQEVFANWQDGDLVDAIDPETAEVKVVDGMQNTLMLHCALAPEFLTNRTAMVEAAFRLFLVNGNVPMTSRELAAKLERPEITILKTLAGVRVYRGLRPISK
ncbi:MAG: hypothetical protein HQ525_02160 [Anaerolineae bacterium]|nr:hypothetical protein [Anaerolineae bacterium]